jgi:hypothetical protein
VPCLEPIEVARERGGPAKAKSDLYFRRITRCFFPRIVRNQQVRSASLAGLRSMGGFLPPRRKLLLFLPVQGRREVR